MYGDLMMRILLTGGRAPVTLELARLIVAWGGWVAVAESLRFPLTRFSNAVSVHDRVPAPAQHPEAFAQSLVEIVKRHRIDWVIPTCEELFFVAQASARFPSHCRVLVAPLPHLQALHNKWSFSQRARRHGLRVPKTTLVSDAPSLQRALNGFDRCVVKPVYSRFGSQTVFLPEQKARLQTLHIHKRQPWVVQALVRGRQLCSYSVAHAGRLTAHGVYQSEFSIGCGTAVAFSPVRHRGVFNWVRRFVEREAFTGQIAFDFIETPQGEPLAIECNPRTTSGIHLFGHQPEFIDALLDPNFPLLEPQPNSRAMLALPMLGCGLKQMRSATPLKRWWQMFASSRDVIYRRSDPWPWLLQGAPLLELLWRSLRGGLRPVRAATSDIEWNGL